MKASSAIPSSGQTDGSTNSKKTYARNVVHCIMSTFDHVRNGDGKVYVELHP